MTILEINEYESAYVLKDELQDYEKVIVKFGPNENDRIFIRLMGTDAIMLSLPAKDKVTPFCTCSEKMAAKAKEILDADK